MLDLLWGFAHIASAHNYVRPEYVGTLALKGAKHPSVPTIMLCPFHWRRHRLITRLPYPQDPRPIPRIDGGERCLRERHVLVPDHPGTEVSHAVDISDGAICLPADTIVCLFPSSRVQHVWQVDLHSDRRTYGESLSESKTIAMMGRLRTESSALAPQTVQALVGSYVPAEYASFRLYDSLLSRLSNEDDMAGFVAFPRHLPRMYTLTPRHPLLSFLRSLSTFALEMRTSASILSLVTSKSLVLIDELGRGSVQLCLRSKKSR